MQRIAECACCIDRVADLDIGALPDGELGAVMDRNSPRLDFELRIFVVSVERSLTAKAPVITVDRRLDTGCLSEIVSASDMVALLDAWRSCVGEGAMV